MIHNAPPAWMEALVGFLTPPACREHVLGDLHERYSSPGQYLADALRVLPLVVFSRVRRTLDLQILFMEAFALYVPLLAAAWRLSGAFFLYGQRGFARAAVPALAALLMLRLEDAYRPAEVRSRHQPAVDAALALAFGFLVHRTVALLLPGWSIPGSTLLAGGGMAFAMLTALRWIGLESRPSLPAAAAGPGSGQNPAGAPEPKSMALERELKREKVSLVGTLAALLFLSWRALAMPWTISRWCGAFMACATIYTAYQVYRYGVRARDVSYRARLERRRDFLRRIWLRYLGPYLTVLLVFGLQGPLSQPARPEMWKNAAPFAVLSVLWALTFWAITRRTVRRLQRELDDMDASAGS